jgi:hypothetical protein
MHPLVIHAIAAERTREVQAHAAAAGRASQLRRTRRTRPTWLLMAVPRGGRGFAGRPASGTRRGPRPA